MAAPTVAPARPVADLSGVVVGLVALFQVVGCGCEPEPGGGAGGSAGAAAQAGAAGASGASGAPSTDGGPDATDPPFDEAGADVGEGDAPPADAPSADAPSDAPPDAPFPPLPPPLCSDGIRDPTFEECDDAFDSASESPPFIDSCDDTCHVRDVPLLERTALAAVAGDAGPLPPDGRTLGTGRHPVAAGDAGFAVAFIESDSSPLAVSLTSFSSMGIPRFDAQSVSAGTTAVQFSGPVVAALPDGQYAVAFTDFNGDGDELGIALRLVLADGESEKVGPLQHANTSTDFGQLDPDVLYTGTEVVVAWVDTSDVFNGPDIRFRTFSASLSPTSAEQTLADTDASEGNVALAPFDGSWAAAWRSTMGGSEQIEVKAGTTRWTVKSETGSPFLPPPAEDKPALAELDAAHLLVVFTEATDPGATGVANTPRLRYAVLDTGAPGEVLASSAPNTISPWNVDAVAQSHANAIRVDQEVYVTWRTSRATTDALAEELWLARWDAMAGVFDPEAPLPRIQPDHQLGDQRRPALAAAPSVYELQGGAIVAAWDDLGRTFGAKSGAPDVVVEFIPSPIVRDDGPPAMTCGAGTVAATCAGGVVCAATCTLATDPCVPFLGDYTLADICGGCAPGMIGCVDLTCATPCDGVNECVLPTGNSDESTELCVPPGGP